MNGVSSAMLKRLCASYPAKVNSQRHATCECDNIVKIELFQSPRCLTRKETTDFIMDYFFSPNFNKTNQNDARTKIVREVAAQSQLMLVVRSDLFRTIDDPFYFQCLDESYKKILQELIIGSHWEGLLTSHNELAFGDHVILIKDVEVAESCHSLNALFEMLKIENKSKKFEMIKIQTIAEGRSVEMLVRKNAESRNRMFTNPPTNANGVTIKQEEDSVLAQESNKDNI